MKLSTALLVVGWLASLLVVAVLCIGIVFLLNRPSGQVVASWQQPGDVTYDRSTYRLAVVDKSSLIGGERYQIYVGRDLKGRPVYGHWVDFTFYGNGADSQRDAIGSATVTWNSSGVTLQTASGQTLFVPAALFVGGR